MIRIHEVDKCLKKYFKNDTKPIQTGELIDYVIKELNYPNVDSVRDQLYEVCVYELLPDYEMEVVGYTYAEEMEELFQSRRGLFNGAQFLIKPTEYEIAENMIVPGHRFYPFCNNQVSPEKIRLSVDGKSLRRKMVQMSMQDSVLYHSILNSEEYHELICNDVDNFDKIIDYDIDQNPVLNFKVFNMSAFYKKHSFQTGDALMATVVDWKKGHCKIEYIPASWFRDKVGDISHWVTTFEESLLMNLDVPEEDWQATAFQQIEDALLYTEYYDEKGLLNQPPIHIGGFLGQAKNIYLTGCDRRTLFWRKDERHPEEIAEEERLEMDQQGMFGMDLMNTMQGGSDADLMNILGSELDEALMSGKIDSDMIEQITSQLFGGGPSDENSFDGLMEIMGFNLCEEEFEAYVRDELFSGGKCVTNVMSRCFDERVQNHYHDLKPKLKKFCKKIWKKVSKNYNRFSDDEAGKIRHTILAILDKHIAWIRELDLVIDDPSALPQSKVMELGELTTLFSQTAIALNTDENVTKKDVATYQKMLSKLEPVVLMMMDEIMFTVKNK